MIGAHCEVYLVIEPVPTTVTNGLAWVVIGAFLAAWLLETRRPRVSRGLAIVAWVVFAAFWLLLIPRFAFVMRSPIETVLSAAAVPGSLYAAHLVRSERRLDTLFVLSRAIAVMGLVYLPFESITALRQPLVEATAFQVHWVITQLGFQADLTTLSSLGNPGSTARAPEAAYQSALVFETGGQRYVTYIVLACTGIGSMSIFAGLVAALDAPLKRKLSAIVLAVSIIHVLNIARNVFIAVAFGYQWFQVLVEPIMYLTGYSDPGLVSFFIADRVLSQSLSVIALVWITWLVVRRVPELLSVLEDVLFILTRQEYDLRRAFSIDV